MEYHTGHLPKAAPYPAQQPLTEWLRETTRERHRELDSSPMLRDLLRPGLSVGRYYHLMLAMWQAHELAEHSLDLCAADCPAELSPYVSRCYALESDLQTLHGLVKTTNTSVDPLVFEKKRVKFEDKNDTNDDMKSYYLGLRYVLEGSSLGSRIIAAQLAKNCPDIKDNCFEYWRLQSSAASEWPHICDIINRNQHQLNTAAVHNGADKAYYCFLNIFRSGTL